MEKGTEKQTILGLLKDILDAIEQLLDLHQFGGSADKFFSLVDKYSELRPVSSFLSSLHVSLAACVSFLLMVSSLYFLVEAILSTV